MRTRAAALLLLPLLAVPLGALAGPRLARDPQAVERLVAWSGGGVPLRLHPATGAVRFVRLGPHAPLLAGSSPAERARDFLEQHGAAFGVLDPERQLAAPESRVDRYGFSHVTYRQIHHGLPVFAGVLRAHFNAQGVLVAVNGTFLPGIDVDPVPLRRAADLVPVALDHVRREVAEAASVSLRAVVARLLVYRSGLVRGVPGADHLVHEIEVAGAGVRELVYVDAHSGEFVERISGMYQALHRTIHQPALNNVVIWDEGDPLPYSSGDLVNDGQVNGLIAYTEDAYDLFAHLSGGAYLSWDAASATMHDVWKSCSGGGLAYWSGNATHYCDGAASDDVVGHEWTHAYTQETHGLIYAWQPGALNESYSDIFGEILDLVNGAGTDSPGPARVVSDCTMLEPASAPVLQVNAPAAVAGFYETSGATFNPTPPKTATALLALVNDGVGAVNDGCQTLVGFPAGRIAVANGGGSCASLAKAVRAQNAGAIGLIVVSQTPGNSTSAMTGTNPSIVIPSVMVGNNDGNALKAQLGTGVNATISLLAVAQSVRWLHGEDVTGGPLGDLWNPACLGEPPAVGDVRYKCAADDNGGVHTNSTVPSHAFALLVDGGTYLGHTVAPLGLTRTAHIYWRAMEAYQVPDTDFADHADALNQSCADLIGVALTDLVTGAPSGVTISASDCAQIPQAMLAVEMTDEPDCVFEPLLAPDPPALACGTVLFSDDFESDPTTTWTRTNSGVHAEYTPRDWEWTAVLPPGGTGSAFFAVDPLQTGDCLAGSDDQSGRMSLDSPPVLLLDGATTLRFDHYVATQPMFDGGNLKISVNAGPFVPIAAGEFLFNSYNGALASIANPNPMAGEPAFIGTDAGEVHGSWGQSQVALAAHAGAGDSVRLRFDFGVNGCVGVDGWYVDNVLVCAAVAAAGRVPDGASAPGPQLLLAKAPADQVTLSWGESCLAEDTDYEVYEGPIGSFAGHGAQTCTTAGTTSASFVPAAGHRYYLIVPRNSTREGSYGVDSDGVERPPGAAPCVAQAVAPGCR